MTTTFPRYNYIISKTLDPVFAILIGVSAAGIRIRREENEKRFGMATTSMVQTQSAKQRARPAEVREEGEVGFGDVVRIGWGRVWRSWGGA